MKQEKSEQVLELESLPRAELMRLGVFANDEEVDRHFRYFFFEPGKQRFDLDINTVSKVKARVMMADFCTKHKEAKGIGFCITRDFELLKGIAWKNPDVAFALACDAARIQLRNWAKTVCVKLSNGEGVVPKPMHTEASSIVPKADEEGFDKAKTI